MWLSDLHDQVVEGIRDAYRSGHFDRDEALARLRAGLGIDDERAAEILDGDD